MPEAQTLESTPHVAGGMYVRGLALSPPSDTVYQLGYKRVDTENYIKGTESLLALKSLTKLCVVVLLDWLQSISFTL